MGVGEGINDLRVVAYPGAFTTDSVAVIKEKIKNNVFDKLIGELTRPPKESSAKLAQSNPKKTVYSGTLEGINSFFLDNVWTDGQPIIPPTIDRIEEFLKYTDLAPHQEIGVLPQAMRRATPWKIAVNGVMAGCKPQFMPVLIAAAEVMADPYLNLRDLATTMMIMPYAIINGPIVKQLGINFDIGTVARGPNPVLGRAIGFMIRNIAGFKVGDNYMGTWGYPSLGMVLAEDEEGSPWEPFHVQHGFDKNVSTVTMGGTMNWGYQLYFEVAEDTEGMASTLADHISDIVHPVVTYMEHDQNMVMVFMTAPAAKMFANGGWTKEKLIDYLWKNSTITVRQLEKTLRYGGRTARKPELWTMRGLIDSKVYDIPESFAKSNPDETLPRLVSPKELHIVVTGDRGRDKAQALWSWYNKPTTKAIKLPAKWEELLKTAPQ